MQLTYPGVYVTEIPSSVRPIATVSTSIGAFIDFFAKGPVNQAVQIFGMADFERVFGGIDSRSEASYQIAQFFLNGGPSAWVVRVAPGSKAADATAKIDTTAATQALTVVALTAGKWGNSLRFSVEPVVDGSGPSAKLFNLYISQYAAPTDTGGPITSEKYLNVSIETTSPRYVVDVVNASSQIARIVAPSGGVKMPAYSGTLGTAVSTAAGFHAAFDGKKFKAQISTAGAAVDCTIAYAANPSDPNEKDYNKLRNAVEAAIRANAATDPAYAGTTVTLIGKRLLVRAGRSKTYETDETIKLTNVAPDAVADLLGFAAAVVANLQEYQLGDTTAVLAQDVGHPGVDGTGKPMAADVIAGLSGLDNVDLFNLLCLPCTTVPGFDSFTAAIGAALTYCETRRAFLLVDIPESVNTPAAMQGWVDDNASTIRSKNTAFYFPRIEVPDPTAEFRLRSIPTSGTVAGIYARTDTERGVWKAPAGVDAVLRGVGGLDYKLNDPENGVLNGLGIDCLRTFPIYGQVVWGARTGVGADAMASEWKYVPIRRLALMIEESLFRGTKWVVFEPNDEPLWAKIRQNVGAFMMNLFRQGAFQGSTPDKAFFVKCDGETTTAADRNLGIVNIEVGFAPLKPAEFVVLKIQQIPDVK